jgi:STOP protein
MENTCILNNEDFPPLSELDHIQRNCFCYLCSCGKHKCPSLNPYHKPSPKLLSSYQEKFSRKVTSPPKPFVFMDELIESKQKMDLKSTAKEDFKAYKVESLKNSNEYRHRSVSPFRFNVSSTYSQNYISYGPLNKGSFSKAAPEYSPIKFMGTSTYAQSFVPPTKTIERSNKAPKKGNILGIGGISILESTSKSTYTNHKETYLSKPFRLNSLDPSPVTVSPLGTTTYASSFFDVPKGNLKLTLRQLEKLH